MITRPPGLTKAILTTGLIAGTLDITGAILSYIIPRYRDPIPIFKFIASGVFGAVAAFSSGWPMAVMGLLLHFCIAIYWTAVFYYAFPAINRVVPNKFAAGIGYGIIVWLAMNLVVIPLSRVPKFPFNPVQASIGVGILIIAIGLPISLRAKRFYSGQ